MRASLSILPFVLCVTGCDWLGSGDDSDRQPFPTPSHWQVQRIDGEAASDAGDAVIGVVAFAEGEVSGVGACNQYGGEYSADDKGRIGIDGLFATEMYCGDDLHPFEERLFEALVGAERWRLNDDGTLALRGSADLVLAPMLVRW